MLWLLCGEIVLWRSCGHRREIRIINRDWLVQRVCDCRGRNQTVVPRRRIERYFFITVGVIRNNRRRSLISGDYEWHLVKVWLLVGATGSLVASSLHFGATHSLAQEFFAPKKEFMVVTPSIFSASDSGEPIQI